MKSYKEMNWEELEECAEAIRYELELTGAEIDLWESRDLVGMPSPSPYTRLNELWEELGEISAFQEALENA